MKPVPLLALWLLGAGAPRVAAAAAPDPPRAEILVVGRALPAGLSGTASTDAGFLREIADRRGVRLRRVAPLSPSPAARDAFPGGAWVVTLEPGASADALVRSFRAEPGVAYAGPNHTIAFETGAPAEVIPNDALFDRQFALAATRVTEAWESSRGEGILVAVIDSGVETTHPDLASQIAVNALEAAGATGVDDDANGLVDDIMGYDFTDAPEFPGIGDYLERDPDPADDFGHGTQVSGIIAAAFDNEIGIAGVAPEARILAVRAGLRTSLPLAPGLLQEDDAAAAILYAVDRGARIVNLSWGDNVDAPVIGQAVAYAVRRGVLVVAAAGNVPADIPYFPSGYPGVLGVGATTREDVRAGFSTFGQDLDLMAPGLGLVTTFLGGTYASANGTSFSAPMVSGGAALVWSLHPEWSAASVAWRLKLSARDGDSGWSPDMGWGIMDAARAVADPEPPRVDIDAVSARGRERRFRGTVADPGLGTWSLSVFPDPSRGGAARTLAQDRGEQLVGDTLAAFLPAPTDSGFWVARLTAWTRDHPALEHRVRFFVEPGSAFFSGLEVEIQAGRDGWDVAGVWDSPERSQGLLRLLGPGGAARTATEAVIAHSHSLRIPGPLPVGDHTVEVLSRGPDLESETRLAALPLRVPQAERLYDARPGAPPPPGTPMPRTVDWDGDGFPEALVEEPAVGDVYGLVHQIEIQGDGTALEIETGLGFRGIPVDAADASGDLLPELAVFRVDGWSVWESRRSGAFPNRQVHGELTGIPLGYVPTTEGYRLVVLEGSRLRSYRADASQGYVKVAESALEDAALVLGRTWADVDQDGVTELALARTDGSIVVWEIRGAEIRREGSWVVSPDLAGAVYLHAGPGANVVTLEPVSATESLDASLRRAAVRVRAWAWDGAGAEERGRLTMAGYYRANEFQWLGEDPMGRGVLLRRGTRVDLLGLESGVTWRGLLTEGTQGAVSGGLLLQVPGQGAGVWLGAANRTLPSGELAWMESRTEAIDGGALVVERVESLSPTSALALHVAWEEDGCPPGVVERVGDVRGTAMLIPAGRSVVDTAALGEHVTYRLLAAPCASRALRVVAERPVVPRIAWETRGILGLDFGVSLSAEARPRVEILHEGMLHPPLAVQEARARRSLLVTLDGPADSVIVTGAFTANGLPAGGARRSAYALPPEPADSTVVLAAVSYRGGGAPSLDVLLRGAAAALDTCAPSFVLEPPGWDLTANAAGGDPLRRVVPLPNPLAAGAYTLRLGPGCPGAGSAGDARSFQVDLAVYPNPVHADEALVVENAPPGSRAALLDPAGKEVRAWALGDVPEREALERLAPGLYFLSLTDTQGARILLQKIVVLR